MPKSQQHYKRICTGFFFFPYYTEFDEQMSCHIISGQHWGQLLSC